MLYWRIRFLARDLVVKFYMWRLRKLMGEVSREHECRVLRYERR